MNQNYTMSYILHQKVYTDISNLYFCNEHMTQKEYRKVLLYKKNLKELKNLIQPNIVRYKNLYKTIYREHGNEYRERGLSWENYFEWYHGGNSNNKNYSTDDLRCYHSYLEGNYYHSAQTLVSAEYTLYHTLYSILNNKELKDIVPNMDEHHFFLLCRGIVNLGDLNINDFFQTRKTQLEEYFSKDDTEEKFPYELLLTNHCLLL